MSIGLQADLPTGRQARSCHGFCIFILTILSYRDKSCSFIGTHPSGQLYRDTEILPTYRDFAKTPAYRQVGMPTLLCCKTKFQAIIF
jgi:hypothetical protein